MAFPYSWRTGNLNQSFLHDHGQTSGLCMWRCNKITFGRISHQVAVCEMNLNTGLRWDDWSIHIFMIRCYQGDWHFIIQKFEKNIPVTELSLIHGLRIIIVICPDKSQGHFVWNPSLSRRENLLCRRGVIPFWLGSYSTVDFDGGDPSLWSHFLGKPKGISKWPHCGGNQTTLKCTLLGN